MNEMTIKSLDVNKFHIISAEESVDYLRKILKHIHKNCPDLMFVVVNKPIDVKSIDTVVSKDFMKFMNNLLNEEDCCKDCCEN